MKRFVLGLLALVNVASVGLAAGAEGDLAGQVRAAERAFAKTMATRDLKSFSGYVSEEGVFFGGRGPLRGREAVVEAWKRFFEAKDAPFSWEPEVVEVLGSGSLALTSGPVHDPEGKLIGTFTTIWRHEADGRWRVVFDKGCPVCEPEKKP
jgi:ketosteroid isomerase-like protein